MQSPVPFPPAPRAPADPGRARNSEALIEHLLRRAGFGASQEEVDLYADLGFSAAVRRLVNFEAVPDTVDDRIGKPGVVAVTPRGAFLPSTVITDARQRWLFRMVQTQRPLQEKMALFWHNHFATAYSKIAGAFGGEEGTRYLAAKASEDPNRVRGQIELFRGYALGNFRDLLVAVAKDTAMLVWLDGRTNVKARPQENFARELMELFTMGVGTFAEEDVYAGARVFTGWNLARPSNAYYAFSYVAGQHDTAAKQFTFPVAAGGSRTIPARSADAGMQDGLDLIDAVARHPATGPRLARKLYGFFVSEIGEPDAALIDEMARLYYAGGFEMRPVVDYLLRSPQFSDPANFYARYSWPAEFVVRAIKEVGSVGFSVNDALTPMANMGQQLFEPPDVSGWDLGRSWFSSGAMLTRMNFAAQLAANQKFNLRDIVRAGQQSPDAVASLLLDRLTPAPLDRETYQAIIDYARSGGAWSGSDTQLATKAADRASDRRLRQLPVRVDPMPITRREFVRGGVTAFTMSFAAPEFLSDLALAQGRSSRNLVVLYLSGGNDALSTVVPYNDAQYYARRPTIAIPASQVLQIGTDRSGVALGLHPRLTGLRSIYNAGRLAIIQRTGYQNSSRSHFEGTDIWSTADPRSPQGTGWLGRYLDTLPSPVDPLAAWATSSIIPHALQARTVGVPSIPSVQAYAFASPNSGSEAVAGRDSATRIASHLPVDRPHLAFVNATSQDAFATLDRVARVASYAPTVNYPANGFAQALKAIAGAMVQGVGTRVFWVQTGGYDTHAAQNPNQANGSYTGLMATLNDGLAAFYGDLQNHSLLGDTLVLQFSEFGRRINENGSQGTDHGAASVMMALGGGVRGGIFGTAPNLRGTPDNPTLENSGNDVHYETDFRSVYARVIDSWLGADSSAILGADFRGGAPAFL